MRVRFRLTPRQVVTQGVAIGFVWAFMVLLNIRLGGASAILLALYGAALATSVLVSGCWRGIELTPDGATVRRNRKRFVPWSDVTNVRTGKLLLTRMVVLDTVTGPVRVWAPASSPLAPDRDFASKVDYIRQWWWNHRPNAAEGPALWPTSSATGWGIPVLVDDAGGRPDASSAAV